MAQIKTILIYITLLGLLINGCKKKEVQLPLIDTPGISEIQNHSSIWVFLEAENGQSKAMLNKNNKILNTHWIFNIDRRLRMIDIVPILIEMQQNRNKDSMHKKEGMLNYFSYADTASKKISLISFEPTIFTTVYETFDSRKKIPEKPCTSILEISDGEFTLNHKRISLDALADKLKMNPSCSDEHKPKVILSYTENTLYQDYLQTKVYLNQNRIACDSVEYLYSVK